MTDTGDAVYPAPLFQYYIVNFSGIFVLLAKKC